MQSSENEQLYRKTPLMGWASWNCFRTNISEEILKQQADALVSTGLAAQGYRYFNTDDGFFGGRNEDGTLRPHPVRFPNGMKVISDYAHSLGLKAGIYAEAGDNTCGFYYDAEGENARGVGLYGHEESDLRTYLADWNYDFIKVDWCGGIRMGLSEQLQYTKIAAIIDSLRHELNRCLVFNICRWQFPGEWAVSIADSWRTGGDITPKFESILYQIDCIKPLRRFCSPGHVNDLDMLQIGNGMLPHEDAAHFAMWCMMSTPLMIGCDLTKLAPETLTVLKNDELIAINQDPACLQAFPVKELRDGETLTAEIWVKDLGQVNSPVKAVAFLNRSQQKMTLRADLHELGLAGSADSIRVRDVMAHTDLPSSGSFTVTLEPHSCTVLHITAQQALPVQDLSVPAQTVTPQRIAREEIAEAVRGGALLFVVREPEEYRHAHMEGALNFPYSAILAAFPDRERTVIVCCNTGKKSSQAAAALMHCGYRNVRYSSLH